MLRPASASIIPGREVSWSDDIGSMHEEEEEEEDKSMVL